MMVLLVHATLAGAEFLYNRRLAGYAIRRWLDRTSGSQYEALNARFTKTLAARQNELPC